MGYLLEIVYFITELIRFNVLKPSVFLYCLRKLQPIRTIDSAQVMAVLIERCGPVLLFIEQIQPSVNYELDHIRDICKNNVIDSDSSAMLMNAYYTCRPDERPKVIHIELSPQQRYLRYLLSTELKEKETNEHCYFIYQKISSFPLQDDTTMEMIVQEVLRVPTICFMRTQSIAMLSAMISHYIPRFQMFLIDAIFEHICIILDLMEQDKYQETVSLMDFVNELYCYLVLNNDQLLFVLYLLIEYNHIVSYILWLLTRLHLKLLRSILSYQNDLWLFILLFLMKMIHHSMHFD